MRSENEMLSTSNGVVLLYATGMKAARALLIVVAARAWR